MVVPQCSNLNCGILGCIAIPPSISCLCYVLTIMTDSREQELATVLYYLWSYHGYSPLLATQEMVECIPQVQLTVPTLDLRGPRWGKWEQVVGN